MHQTTNGIDVTEGDIYFGWKELDDFYINGFTSNITEARSWALDPYLGWTNLADMNIHGNFLVRVRFEEGSSEVSSDWPFFQ
jgi:hypothetical protein